MKARIKFKKYGALRFIGHLDVMRFFQKAIRRAHIPIAYTGGYSPHMIMSFANPLGIGITSEGRGNRSFKFPPDRRGKEDDRNGDCRGSRLSS